MTNIDSQASSQPVKIAGRATLRGHIEIARIDHWFKNVFVIPGAVAAFAMDPGHIAANIPMRAALGLASVCLVASSNYVINEVLDAPSDLAHPTKHTRPVPAGKVNVPLAYVQWLLLMVVGVGLGYAVSTPFAVTVFVLWVMGCIYNIRPVRSKDLPYLDVLSEAVNNPLRMLAGWYIVGTASVAPGSLLLSYWMVGCYFMAMKRYAEYREIANPARAAAYRKSFKFYTEERLLVSIMFYGSAAMLFLGAFVMRYRLELFLSFPLIALVMALYLFLGLKPNSTVQRPEGLYREPTLMAAVVGCSIAITILMLVDIPGLPNLISPTAPTIQEQTK
ncbi:MAG TPA: UbiA prenyltransferase family protein [Polyangiaceae bacterium]|nr:UbiA prenyltransferase family protein [Polyangiaceae bacterium]